jgi:predicted dehydrogenase
VRRTPLRKSAATDHRRARDVANTTRYGIVGCGMMGQEHLANIALLPGTAVTHIVEPDAAMAARGCETCGAALSPSLGALLDEPIDCLVIASPNHRHIEHLEAVAARRPDLPVLVEKPLFTCADDLARLAALPADLRERLWVAMEYRYMPPIAAFLAEADAVTGGIVMLTIREHRFPFLPKVGDWNRFNANTGGTFVEKCCHFFDLMRLAMRSEPVRVMASAGQAANHLDERYDGRTPDIWDHGYVIVDFESGARAMLELCMFAEGSRYQEELCAVGPRGKLEALVPGPQRFWPAELGPPPEARIVVSPRSPRGPRVAPVPVDPVLIAAGDHNGATFYQHQRFLACVRGEARPEVTCEDGRAAVLMGLAAQHSAATGEAVDLRTFCR